MARTLVAFGPSGLDTPSVRFCDDADSVVGTVTLTEDTNCKGRYQGDAAPPAQAGVFDVVLLSGSNALGTYEGVEILNQDPEKVVVRDTTVPEGVPRFGKQHKQAIASGQEAFVTFTDEQAP